MARIAGEARGDKGEWTLLFRSLGWQQTLRVKQRSFETGNETKERMRERLMEDIRRHNAEVENNDGVVNLSSYLTPKTLVDSTSKSGFERNNNSSVISGRSTDPRGPGPGPPPLSPPSPPAASAGRWRQEKSRNAKVPMKEKKKGKEMILGKDRDVVLAGIVDDFRGSSAGVSTTSCSSLTAEKKRQNFVAAAEPFPSGERTPEQLLPVLSTKVRGLLPAAGPHADSVLRRMDHGSESSSLDEAPAIRDEVDNFIIHGNNKLVSITTLPVYIDGVLTGGASVPEKVYLVGTVGPDRVMFKQRVEMWRLMLDPAHRPRYLLRTKKGAWVKLQKAQDDYSKYYNEVLALGHFLNFAQKLPNASPTAAELDLQKMCSMHSNKASLDKVSRHVTVIRSFIEEDKAFARSPLLRKVFPNLFFKRSSPKRDQEDEWSDGWDTAGFKRNAGKLPLKSESSERKEKRYKVLAKKDIQKPSNGERLKRQWDNVSRLEYQYEDGQRSKDLQRRKQRKIFSQAELDVEDPPICVLCDDGGDLIYCDGPCHRHFHPTKESGAGSFCETLGFTKAEVKDMDKYYCPNCVLDQQQCFICGALGSSVPTSKGREVRCCDVQFCKRFFHVECAAEMVSAPKHDWHDLAENIYKGREELYCPRHCCSVCGEAEMKEPGTLVQCRRCPKAWHRPCLTNFYRSMELESTTIWNHYDREFIYCREHKIIPKLQTPKRNHVKFPVVRSAASN